MMLVKNVDEGFKNLISYDMQKMRLLYWYVTAETILDIKDFSEKFMRSNVRKDMENWHPHYSNEDCSELAVDFIVLDKPNVELSTQLSFKDDTVASWIGMAYSFFRYYTSLPSKIVVEILSFDTMLRYYSIGHEMDFEAWADRVINEVNASGGY